MTTTPRQRHDDDTGLTLRNYVETRFNLLIEATEHRATAQDDVLRAHADFTKAAALAVKEAAEAARVATDLRYQQRFEAQSDALAAAFLSQQTAMQTAFVVAEKAVQAALAAADRAVSKAELAADKRFEALNELRQMLNEMVSSLMPRTEANSKFEGFTEKMEDTSKRIEGVEGRLNQLSGEASGKRGQTDDSRAVWAVAIAVAAVLVNVAMAFWK